jgi:hypothetical protein
MSRREVVRTCARFVVAALYHRLLKPFGKKDKNEGKGYNYGLVDQSIWCVYNSLDKINT